jgi:hypothetical protein
MEGRDMDGMIGIGGRWWRFPGARIDTDSWEVEWRSDGKLYLLESSGNIVEGVEVIDVMPPRLSSMKDHPCCYYQCHRPGTVFIGMSGNPDTHWICFFHFDLWHADRARFLADGIPCEMEELPRTANNENPVVQPTSRTGRAQSQPGPDYPLDRGRMLCIDEIRIISSTQIAGNEAPARDDVVKRYPKIVREQFPGRAAYIVRPIPEGAPPAYIFMVALVCYQPTSDTAAELFELVVSWSSDDLDPLPELIEREIRDIEWDWMARSKGWSTPADQP